MSTLTADPKFPRGHVLGINYSYYDTENNPQDLQIGTGQGVKGVHSVFRDENPHDGKLQSNLTVECVAVKNVSGDVLTAGTKVQLDPTRVLVKLKAPTQRFTALSMSGSQHQLKTAKSAGSCERSISSSISWY